MSSLNSNKENPLVSKSFNFSLQIVRICQQLQLSNNFVSANQLVKSGTSIGANIREAQSSESNLNTRRNYIPKLIRGTKDLVKMYCYRPKTIYHIKPITTLTY